MVMMAFNRLEQSRSGCYDCDEPALRRSGYRLILLDHAHRPQNHDLLEETGLPYNIKSINIGKGEQFDGSF